MQAHKHTTRITSEDLRRRRFLYWWQSKAWVGGEEKKKVHHLLYLKASGFLFLARFFSHSTAWLHLISITEVHIESLRNAFIRNAITQVKIPLYRGSSAPGEMERETKQSGIGAFHATYCITHSSCIRLLETTICIPGNPVQVIFNPFQRQPYGIILHFGMNPCEYRIVFLKSCFVVAHTLT